MERSQIIGGTEECQSSESGWTMYIGSPIDDDDDDSDDDIGDNDDDNITQAEAEEDESESDDSMASDASSGPSHYGNPWGNGLAGEEEHDDEKSCIVIKKENKTRGKKIAERKVEKKTPEHQGAEKVRKNYWVEKRK